MLLLVPCAVVCYADVQRGGLCDVCFPIGCVRCLLVALDAILQGCLELTRQTDFDCDMCASVVFDV